jgi:PA domain-containing protein
MRAILALLLALAPVTALANSQIFIVNINAAGVGFNDPTPAMPIGGNPGTTIGEQRLNAFQAAADIWGSILDSKVPIFINAQFTPLACTATQAVLGSAGAATVSRDFAGAGLAQTWYHAALANRISGQDLSPSNDINANFNVNLGNPGCLTGTGWYLGFDNNHGSQIDLVTVLLHEFGHGLGFSSFVSRTDGSELAGQDDIYETFMIDNVSNARWTGMTNAVRFASMVNFQHVVLDGPQVVADIPSTLGGTPTFTITAPPALARNYSLGTAGFGAPFSDNGVSGDLALIVDGGGASTSDGCEPATNNLTGKLAVIDRGTCAFTVKALTAQNAGAIGVIIVNNVAGVAAPGLGGSDANVHITAIGITLEDGNTIKTALGQGTVTGRLFADRTRLAGADAQGRGLVYTPNPVVAGSSVSHWDISATPNLLMEPAINGDLLHRPDLTLSLFRDIGWAPDRDLDDAVDGVDNCPSIANAGQEDGNHDGIGDVCKMTPVLNCVKLTRNGLVARFGYINPETVSRSLVSGGAFNFLLPASNGSPPSSFAAGTQNNVFEATFPLKVGIWVVGDRFVVAQPFATRCAN